MRQCHNYIIISLYREIYCVIIILIIMLSPIPSRRIVDRFDLMMKRSVKGNVYENIINNNK